MEKEQIGIILVLLLFTIAFTGCFENEKGEEERITLWIRNKTSYNLNVNISISIDSNIVFNESIIISSSDYYTNRFELEEKTYDFKLSTNNLTHNIPILIDYERDHLYFDINQDSIKFIPPPSK